MVTQWVPVNRIHLLCCVVNLLVNIAPVNNLVDINSLHFIFKRFPINWIDSWFKNFFNALQVSPVSVFYLNPIDLVDLIIDGIDKIVGIGLEVLYLGLNVINICFDFVQTFFNSVNELINVGEKFSLRNCDRDWGDNCYFH